MKGKTLRRTTWCRLQDFENQLQPDAIKTGYTRATWEPASIDNIQGRATWQILRGEDIGKDPFFSMRELRDRMDFNEIFLQGMADKERFARQYISYLRTSKKLYNPNWAKWSWKYDDDSIKLRYRVDRPWEPLGIAVLERDY